jgi:hypothetical protein
VSDADIVSLAFGTNALQKLTVPLLGGVCAKRLYRRARHREHHRRNC